MTANLPEGYYARPVTLEDARQIAMLHDAQARWLNGTGESIDERAEELRLEWNEDFFNLETDGMAVFTRDHQAVGYAAMLDFRAPHVSLSSSIIVHPEHMRRGIGTFLADWLEERGRQNVSKAPMGARVVLIQGIQSTQQAAVDLLTRRGYCHMHNGYRMRIDFEQPPAAPVVPEGIVIRAIQGEAEERLALFARYESFQDHRGAVVETFEEYYRRWKGFLDNDTFNDPTLWFLALDGDQPAGVAVNYAVQEDDPEMGWVQSLGVRRPWRRRGLGLALLQTSFRALYARGKRRAGLGVDATSLTGANRLYERAGMYVERTYQGYELVLREGQDLTKQELA